MPPSSSGDSLVGVLLADRYHLVEIIGRGGMSVVYLAEHVALQRKFAVKVLRQELLLNKAIVRRFTSEGRTAGQIGHPNIVECIDVGMTPDKRPYLVLEHLQGRTVGQEIERHGALQIAHALNIAIDSGRGLSAAHECSLVHRDIKPENIFLVRSRHGGTAVKVLDFGIAKLLGDVSNETRAGMLVGTPQYMSPEQISTPDVVDGRADVYALGAVLFEMLSGIQPFATSTFPKILSDVVELDPGDLGAMRQGLDPDVVGVVKKAMAKRVEDRFQTMNEMVLALETVAERHQPAQVRIGASGSTGSPRAEALTLEAIPALPQLTPVGAPTPAGTGPGFPPLPVAHVPPSGAAPQETGAPLSGSPRPQARATSRVAVGVLVGVGLACVLGTAAWFARRSHSPFTSEPSAHAERDDGTKVSNASGASADVTSAPSTPPSASASTPSVTASAIDSARVAAVPPTPVGPTGRVDDPYGDGHASSSPSTVATATAPSMASASSAAPTSSSATSSSATSSSATSSSATGSPTAPSTDPSTDGHPAGYIDPKEVSSVVRSHAGEARACFERAKMDDASVAGTVVISAAVSTSGSVSSSSVASSSADNSRLESCLAAAFRAWKFPAPTGGVTGHVSYTFNFK